MAKTPQTPTGEPEMSFDGQETQLRDQTFDYKRNLQFHIFQVSRLGSEDLLNNLSNYNKYSMSILTFEDFLSAFYDTKYREVLKLVSKVETTLRAEGLYSTRLLNIKVCRERFKACLQLAHRRGFLIEESFMEEL